MEFSTSSGSGGAGGGASRSARRLLLVRPDRWRGWGGSGKEGTRAGVAGLLISWACARKMVFDVSATSDGVGEGGGGG